MEAEYFESPLLGRVRVPTEIEEAEIDLFATECTLAVFQKLGKRLKELGLMLSIDMTNFRRDKTIH